MITCTHCGTTLPEGARFCAKCGAAQTAPDQAPAPAPLAASQQAQIVEPVSVPTPPAAQPAGKRTLWMVIGAVAVVGVLVAGYLLFFMRTPRQVLLLANARYFGAVADGLNTHLGTYTALQQRESKEATASKVVVTAGLQTTGANPNGDAIRRVLDKSSITVQTKKEPKSFQSLTNVALNLRGSEVLSADIYAAPDRWAAQAPVLYDRYVILENRDLTATMRKLGLPYSGPDHYPTAKDYQDAINANELVPIALDYVKYLQSTIKEQDVTLQKGVTYQSPDGNVKVRQVTLALSEDRIKETLKGLYQKLQGDDKALDLLAGDVANLMKLAAASASADPEMQKMQNKDYVKQKIRDGGKSFNDSLDNAIFPGGLKVTLLVDSRNTLVSEVIRFGAGQKQAPNNATTYQITLTNWKGKGGVDRNVAVSLTTGPNQNGDSFQFEVKNHQDQPAGKQTRSTTAFTVQSKIGGTAQSGRADLVSLVERDAAKGKDRFTYELSAADQGTKTQVRLKLSSLRSQNPNGKRYEDTSDVTLTVSSAAVPPVDLTLKIDTGVDFGQKVEFPTFTGSNSINLSTANTQEVNRLQTDLGDGLTRFMQRNSSLFDF